MTTSKRQYVKSGLWGAGNSSKVRTEKHTHRANGRWFETEEQARKAKAAKNLTQRLRYQVPNPVERRKLLMEMTDGNGNVDLSRLIKDSVKLDRIKQLIEDGASTKDFIMKVIEIIEGE